MGSVVLLCFLFWPHKDRPAQLRRPGVTAHERLAEFVGTPIPASQNKHSSLMCHSQSSTPVEDLLQRIIADVQVAVQDLCVGDCRRCESGFLEHAWETPVNHFRLALRASSVRPLIALEYAACDLGAPNRLRHSALYITTRLIYLIPPSLQGSQC